MFDIKNFYQPENEKVLQDYENSITDIKNILNSIEAKSNIYFKFFSKIAKKILYFYEYEKKLNLAYIYTKDFKYLLKENNSHYTELFFKKYLTSFYNPEYSFAVFGNDIGPLMSYFYKLYHDYISYSAFHKIFKMYEYNKLFIEVYESFNINDKDKIKETVLNHIYKKDITKNFYHKFTEEFHPEFSFYTNIINNSDFNDLRYLFKTGAYISKNEIKTAEFLLKYTEKKIDKTALTLVNSYYHGFKRDNKPLGKRKIIGFYLNIGQEIIYKNIFKKFFDDGFICTVREYDTSLANEQFEHDHKFDIGLYLNENYLNNYINQLSNALELNKEILMNVSGTIYFEKFGKAPFNPQDKKGNIKLNDFQKDLYSKLKSQHRNLLNNYILKNETSYCMIAFPTPEIGKIYKKIFNETYKINTLNSAKFEKIQQKIINILDKSDFIHVKGKNDNLTNLTVKMNKINKPAKETNFINSTSSVNIPLGEVFTSPCLKDTNGILHIKNSLLNDIVYKNLKLKFQNGFITEYNCENYNDKEKNIQHIKENLLFPHDTLPIGEFAVGTNTLAYKISNKYNIIDRLPILIIEKMGPHFAVGDTCFAQREDHRSYNLLNGKEFIAKDNEKSILRKTDVNSAYTNVHIDITLPYNEIEFITAVSYDNKKIDIIKDGLFVLKGTESLNKNLKNTL